MKLGMSTATYFGTISTENSFGILKSMGISDAEVFLSTYCEYEQNFIDKVVSQIGNIKIHSVHALGTQFEPELFSNSDRVQNDAIKILRKFLSAAKAMKAEYYTFHGPLKVKKKPYNLNYQMLAKKINFIIDICKEYEIKLAYENVHYSYFDSPFFFDNIKSLCPDLYAVFDIKHSHQSGYNYKDYLKVIGERLAIVHLCDVNLDNSTTLPFQGIVDFESLFLEVKKYNSKAILLLELYGSDYTDLNQVNSVYESLNIMLNEVDRKLIKFEQK